jgi:hypothetical protein
LRKTYLNELVSVGWIESLDVRNGNTKKAYYPIVVPSETCSLDVRTRETNETKIFPQFFTFHKINIPKNFELLKFFSSWLIYQILGLWKCGIQLGNAQYSIDNYNDAIQFLDVESTLCHSRSRITMRHLIILVIRKEITFLDFASAAICNLINSFFFLIIIIISN